MAVAALAASAAALLLAGPRWGGGLRRAAGPGLAWAQPGPGRGGRGCVARADALRDEAAAPRQDWYPGCAADLDLPAPAEPDPDSKRSRKHREKRARVKAEKRAAREHGEQRDGAEPEDRREARPVSDEELAAARLRREESKRKELESFLQRAVEAPTVCIDCEWEPAMSQRQLASFVRTLGICYGSNKVAERPFRLLFSGVRRGSRTSELLRKICGFEHWGPRVEIAEEPYLKLFPRQRLVYMSPEGEDVADSFEDSERVFVVGGLNDANHLPGKSRLKADLQGIASVRLPLEEHLQLRGRDAILVPNQVLDIMLDRRRGLSWPDTLAAHTPCRKLQNKPP